MRLPRADRRRGGDSTIALINVVFLMLIFFLIVGTLAPPLDPEVALISTEEAEGTEPPEALFATADGRLRARGREVGIEEWLAEREREEGEAPMVRLAADRELPAATLIDILARLREGGAGTVRIVTERQ